MAWVSILTMFNNYPDIFDDMVLPDGVEKEVVINSIVSELAELDVLYSNPIVLKPLIAVWSNKELYNWKKLYAHFQKQSANYLSFRLLVYRLHY